jgi:hypothetical protein
MRHGQDARAAGIAFAESLVIRNTAASRDREQ